jgi:ferredoxin
MTLPEPSMQIKQHNNTTIPTKLHLIYFSPTGSTRRIVEQIALGINAPITEQHNLTLNSAGIDTKLTEGIAIIGVPVYAGRMPEICQQRMEKLSADQIPAVLVVLYGNREFEDALVELRDFARSKGFIIKAAAAFIGEHSYSTATHPVAANRPDQVDLNKARQFGEAIAQSLQEEQQSFEPVIPGTVPYRERPPLGGISPSLIQEHCTRCGACITICPTNVITLTDQIITDAAGCIMCCACVKNCPEQARVLDHPMLNARREMLTTHCSARKEPLIIMVAAVENNVRSTT